MEHGLGTCEWKHPQDLIEEQAVGETLCMVIEPILQYQSFGGLFHFNFLDAKIQSNSILLLNCWSRASSAENCWRISQRIRSANVSRKCFWPSFSRFQPPPARNSPKFTPKIAGLPLQSVIFEPTLVCHADFLLTGRSTVWLPSFS